MSLRDGDDGDKVFKCSNCQGTELLVPRFRAKMEVSGSAVEITKEEVKSFCLRYFLEKCEDNIDVISYEVAKMGNAPVGYLGRHNYLNVLVNRRLPSGNREEKIRFFMKTAPSDVPAYMEYVEGFGVFKKETTCYKYAIPRLQDINIESGYFAPKCFSTKKDFLVFENLIEQGFKLGAKRDGILDYDHLMCALKSLANLHSASIILEMRTNKTIPELYKGCTEENAYPSGGIRTITFNKAVGALSELIKQIPKYRDSAELSRILETFPVIFRTIFDLCKTSTVFKNVFSHGDLWANNLMFKYSDRNTSSYSGSGGPVECRMVDFQLARYAPPILDVITVLTIPTSSTFRKAHLVNLLDNYYHFLGQHLLRHNVNVEDVLPRTEYNRSIQRYQLAGLIESCLFSHLTILPDEVSSALVNNSDSFDEFLLKQRSQLCVKAFEIDDLYRERLTDMISDVVDNYILGKHSSMTKV